MTRRRRRFAGGYRFTRFEGQPAAALLELDPPESVTIPLKQGFRDPVSAVVAAGDTVSAGQIVGRGGSGLSSPVHASVAGVVEEVRPPDPAKHSAGCVVIRAEGAGPWLKAEGHTRAWQDLPADTIEDLLHASGVTALGGGGLPTRHGSALIGPDEVEDVIVHDTGSEMYNLSLPLLLDGERLQHFVAGLEILRRVMPGARLHVALDKRETGILDGLSQAGAGAERTEIHALAPKFPQDHPGILVPTLLGRAFPHGYAAANIGVVTLDCQAVLHVYDAVAEGKPVIERIVALCGPGFRRAGHARVPVGTPVGDVTRQAALDAEGLRFVRNSVLTGERLNNAAQPIDRTFSALIALPEHGAPVLMPFVRPGFGDDAYSRTFASCVLPTTKRLSANLKGEHRPCVSCGYCQDVCPVGIVPHLLYKYVSRGYLEDGLVDLRIFDCIGCNLCSYVCPSKIAVGSHIRSGQSKLLDEGVDNSARVLPCFDLKGIEPEAE